MFAVGCSDSREYGTRERAAEKAERAGEKSKEGMNNAATTTAVKSKLVADVRLSTLTSINVDSNDGVVTLSGSVPTAADKQKAETVALSVDGVRKVVNNLEVKP
jgi:hyperosmotically inducible protein